jgi:hypothetical protein|tara:strand:- start:73 stop:366 length:294 start_codon:yes stop_codon:yes gene_type:complete
MSDLANWLRVIAKEMAAHDEPASWHQPIVEAADEIEKLRAESQKLAAFSHAYLSDYQEARGEIEKLRKAILDALKLADLDAIKSFRKTLLMALGEKE